MIHKRDVQWWALEAEKHPESARTIIEELAKRLVELDAENERLRNELIRLRRRAPRATSSTEVKTLRRKVETLQDLLHSKEPSEASVVFLPDHMRSARMALSQVQRSIRDGRPVLDHRAMLQLRCMLLAHPGDELILLTSQGRGFTRMLADVLSLAEEGTWPDVEGPALQPGERLAAATTVGEPPRFWTVATRRGYVQRFVRVRFDRVVAQGDRLFSSPFRNDEPVTISIGDRGDLLLVTRWGKGIRFSQRAIETQGSVALELDPDDEVVDGVSLPADADILIVTASGYVARRDTSLFRARSRPGGAGKSLIQAHDVLAVDLYASNTQLLYLTYAGRLVSVPTADVPLRDRLGKGTHLRDMDRDPAVTVALTPLT